MQGEVDLVILLLLLLLLFQVLLGETETMVANCPMPELAPRCDSRRVVDRHGRALIQVREGVGGWIRWSVKVVRRPEQVLPYCILHLRKESLSGEYTLPG